jgi:hypothetical protein
MGTDEDNNKALLMKQGVMVWTGFIWLKSSVADSCEHSNEASSSIKGIDFLIHEY